MAYVYQKALVRELGLNKLWQEVDISAMTISAILAKYADAVVVLTNQFIQGEVSFELTKNIPLFLRPNLTLSAWLSVNGDTTLPTTPGIPSVQYKTIEYAAAHQAGFHVKKVHPDTHPDVYSTDDLLKDLLLSRGTGTDYNFIQRRTMVNVNGIFHRTEATLHGVYVKNGGETSKIGNDNSIGIVSFANVGTLEYIPITTENLYKQDPSQAYSKRAYINTGMDLDNKVVILVLAGVLHVLDGSYFHTGNGQIAIRTEKTNFLRRFVELRKEINLHSVAEVMPTTYTPLELENGTNTRVVVDEVFSDAAVEKFLTLPQSFLVVVDTPYINTVRKAVLATDLPGVSLAYEKPIGILKQRSGLSSSYTRVKQHHLWSLQYKPHYERDYYFETTEWVDLPITNNSEDILNLNKSGFGYLLEIGKEELTIE